MPLEQEHSHPPATPSLLDSSWLSDNTPAPTLDLDFRPVDAASPYEVGVFGTSELGHRGCLLSSSQASTQLMTHPVSVHTNGSDHKDCECISCLGIWKSQEPSYGNEDHGGNSGEAYYSCRLLGCLHTEPTYGSNEKDFLARQLADLRRHEKAHFGTNGHFRCLSDRCTFVTKRWSDLKRHSTVMHCKNAKKFPCTVPYCKFAGDNNGFLRKDKLTSHFNRVHKGVKAAPRGTLRAIKSAPAKEAVDGAESASGEKAA